MNYNKKGSNLILISEILGTLLFVFPSTSFIGVSIFILGSIIGIIFLLIDKYEER